MSLHEIHTYEHDGTEYFDEMWEDDNWEDQDWEASVNAKYPGWFLVKLPGFSTGKFLEVKEWLPTGCKYGAYKPVGWSTGCSTSVGVVFESKRDAMFFKLRWR